MAVRKFEQGGWLNFMIDLPVRVFFAVFAALPYRFGLSLAGRITSFILAPVFGVNARIRANLLRVWPEMPEEEIRRLCHRVSDNSTRLMLESFNIAGFIRHAKQAELSGDGADRLLLALKNHEPVVLVSGHFGNYQTLRVLLAEKGFATAAIYRPMNNAFTNTRYIEAMNAIASPNFARGLAGTRGLLGHLRKGGAIALLNDQAAREGVELRFFGEPALTMTSAAEFAIKYNAHLFPYYGIRQPNGVDFCVEIQEPIALASPEDMTQSLNDSLEGMVRRYPEQWFWIHRRWKQWR
ncbi:MAG: lauroyl acyltransferase [Alphaproteobacteria bacterium]|nr:lauroyl acyltransferase [Alphaproteobacteria bacterium]